MPIRVEEKLRFTGVQIVKSYSVELQNVFNAPRIIAYTSRISVTIFRNLREALRELW